MAGVLLLSTGGACNWLGPIDDWGKGTGGGSHGDAGAAPDAPVVVVDAAVTPDAPAIGDAYAAMCRHYCQTLEETDLLACVAGNRDVERCQTLVAGTTDGCFNARCVQGRVDLSLCFTQCGVVAREYGNRCPPAGDPADPLCPSSTADHDAACRAGCVL
jgi:hypothetical protein